MKDEYCIVELDVSRGSAYEYRKDSEIPTKIKFGRVHNGRFQKGKIVGCFDNNKLHNLIYSIKRGFLIEDIEFFAQTNNK